MGSDKAMNGATLELTQKIQTHFPRDISIDILKAWNGCRTEIITQCLYELFGKVPEFGISADKFTLLKEVTRTVPVGYVHKKQLAKFAENHRKEFIFYDKDITDNNFSKVSNQLVPGKTYKIKFWLINEDVEPEETLPCAILLTQAC